MNPAPNTTPTLNLNRHRQSNLKMKPKKKFQKSELNHMTGMQTLVSQPLCNCHDSWDPKITKAWILRNRCHKMNRQHFGKITGIRSDNVIIKNEFIFNVLSGKGKHISPSQTMYRQCQQKLLTTTSPMSMPGLRVLRNQSYW